MIHLLLIAALTLAGCYSSGNADIKKQEMVAKVQIGKSTKEDVRRLFGDPNQISRQSSEVVNPVDTTKMITLVEYWSYIHGNARADAKSYIPFVGGLVGGSSYDSEVLRVGYDAKGVVQHVSSESAKGENRGMLNPQ